MNVYKSMCKDSRFVAGAGAAEIEVARRLQIFADSTPGLEQYRPFPTVSFLLFLFPRFRFFLLSLFWRWKLNRASRTNNENDFSYFAHSVLFQFDCSIIWITRIKLRMQVSPFHSFSPFFLAFLTRSLNFEKIRYQKIRRGFWSGGTHTLRELRIQRNRSHFQFICGTHKG